LILADLFDVAQNDRTEDFKEFLSGSLISSGDGFFFLLISLNGDLKGGFFQVVDLKVLSGIVKALEEMHWVSQSDVHFHFVDVLEDFGGLGFTVDEEGDLRSAEFEFVLVGKDLVFIEGSGFGVSGRPKEDDGLDFEDFHNEIWNHQPEVFDLIP
jgi:hypothetical protein